MSATVFITGASSGIGAALARHYGQQGATLGLAARRHSELLTLVEHIGARASVYPVDVANSDAVAHAARDFMGAHGVPDIVVANAGISVGTLGGDEGDVQVLERVFRVNVIGLAATLQPFVDPMRARGTGRLVGIASVAGVRGLPGAGAYSASKAAVKTLLESLRLDLHGTGVRVVTISPGYIDTPMTKKNPYPMPFLMPPEVFAAKAAAAIDRGKSFAVIPWPMGLAGLALRAMPNWLYDRLFARAPRKPRGVPP
jgi:short-subunit dehydrogenase